jgi:hypothetical protein
MHVVVTAAYLTRSINHGRNVFTTLATGYRLRPQRREQQVLGEEVERRTADVLHRRLEQGRRRDGQARRPGADTMKPFIREY